MKKITILFAFLLLGIINCTMAQDKPSGNSSKENYFKFQARVKGGIGWTFTALPLRFDTVTITNPVRDTFHIITDSKDDILKTKLGPYAGVNFDFYFHPNFGIGLDGDFFYNKIEFNTPRVLQDYLNTVPDFYLVETNRKNQYFIFTGIGPSFKLFTNKHWDIDLNLRGGLSILQMGSLNVSVDSAIHSRFPRTSILEYDYSKIKLAFGAKAGLYVNYWINSWIGVTLGADYIHSFVSPDKINEEAAYVFKYKDPNYFSDGQGNFDEFAYFYSKNELDKYPVKKFNINHVSVSAGLVFRVAEIAKAGPKNKDIVVLVTRFSNHYSY